MFVNRRTLQRDLVELGALFPVVTDDRSRPYSWWLGELRDVALPPLIPADGRAVALRLRVGRGHLAAVQALLGEGAETITCQDALEVRVSVPETMALRRALFGLADGVEVLAPLRLRRELTEHVARACALYR